MIKKITHSRLYSLWAEKYDSWPTVRGEMQEKGILDIIGEVKEKDILDLGCGTGKWSLILAKKGAKVTSVDNSKEMLNVLKEKKDNLKINILNKDILKLKLNKKFDIIIMGLVIDHIKDIDELFKIVSKHLKQEGIFLFSDPIYFSEIKKPIKKEIKIMENKYKIDYYVHPEQEIIDAAGKNNLKIIQINKLLVDKSVKHIFDSKPHKSYSDYKGKHILTIYKIRLKDN
jgi:2-polyprenyl-3-methyl-5-hydroxy-6-metoxy-1,4-benzoquinol methylase